MELIVDFFNNFILLFNQILTFDLINTNGINIQVWHILVVSTIIKLIKTALKKGGFIW